MRLRATVLLAGLALALALGWLTPRLSAPPGRPAVAMRLLETGRAREAALLFEDPAWRGVAEHRAGRHRRAVAAFLVEETTETLYNAGVAHAHVHHWAASKAAFAKALRLAPDHEDARHNLAVVERAEAAEAELLAAVRGDDAGEGPAAGGRESASDEAMKGDERVKAGEARDGDTRAADAPSERGGRADGGGLPGETRRSSDAQGGAAVAADDEAEAAPDGATGAMAPIRRESAQAAAILLRRIEDDPERVLAARLRAVHALRREREAVGR